MNIACIFYSRTGHTRSITEDISMRIHQSGHTMDCYALPLLMADDHTNGSARFIELANYDMLILGTPVNGGRPSIPMQSFLEQLPDLTGKYFTLVVTHFFRRGWGAIQTLQELRSTCISKGGIFLAELDIKWFSIFRKWDSQKAVNEFVEELLSFSEKA